MKRALVGLAVIAVLILGVAVVAPGFVDWSKYKPEIISRVHDATGYDVAIGGALSLKTLPAPHLLVENLSVSVPGAKEPLVVLDRAEVSVALFPLLGGRVVVSKVYLLKPQIKLETAADGTTSWTVRKPASLAAPAATASAAPSPAGGGVGNAVALNDISIENGSVLYADKRSGKSYAFDKVNMSLHGDTLAGPFTANGDFIYNGQNTSLSLKSGRVEDGADSVAVSVTAGFHDLDSKLVFSGVVGLKGDHEVQGETDFGTLNLAQFLDFVGAGQMPPALGKSFAAKGMLTASAAQFSYQNLKITFDKSDFTGSIGARNLKGEGGKPMAVDVTLTSAKEVDIPQTPSAAPKESSGGKGGSKTGAASSASSPFLPTSLSLPADLTASVNLTAPAVKYGDMKLSGFNITGNWQDRKADGSIKGDLPGGGGLDGSFVLTFGSSSRAAAGGVTLSDPVLSYKVSFKAADGRKTLGPFVPQDKAKDILPLLKGAVAANLEGEVRPAALSIKKGLVTAQDMPIAINGSWTPSRTGGRGALTVAASAEKIDIDRLMGAPAPASAPAEKGSAPAAAPINKDTIKETTEKIALPFDLDLSLSARSLRWKEADYNNVSIAGRLAGKALELKTLQAQDQKGNNIVARGTVGDIAALKDLDLSLQGKTGDLKKLATGFNPQYASLPDALKEAEVVAEFKGQAEKLSFTANLKALDGTLDATGSLADVLDHPSVSGLTLRLRNPNYVDVARLFNPEFHAGIAIKKNLDVFGSMERKDNVYVFNNLKVTIGPSSIDGDLTVDMSGARPSIKASLQMGEVPLNQLIGHDASAQAQTASGGGASENARPAGHWSRTPIDADLLRKFDLDMKVSVQALSYGTWLINNGSAAVTLKDGKLTVTKLTGGMYGGQVSLAGSLAAPDKTHGPLTAEGTADLKNVALESFVSSFASAHLVKASGTINVNTDFKTSGASPNDLISALSGKGSADGKNIVFDGFDLAKLSRTLAAPSSSVLGNVTSVLNTTMQGGSTSFDTLNSNFTISQGVINIAPLDLKGKDANVASPGTINLPLWTINMESTITLITPKDAPPLKVEIKGPLDQPGRAFGQSALNAYIAPKVQNVLNSVLQKNGLIPKTQAPTAAQPAAGGTAAPQPAPAPQKIKPKDLFNNVLQGVLQGH